MTDKNWNRRTWKQCNDPKAMLSHLLDGTEKWRYDHGVTPRKLRLLACAWVRLVWDKLTDIRSRKGVEAGEMFADGLISREELQHSANTANEASPGWPIPQWAATSCAIENGTFDIEQVLKYSVEGIEQEVLAPLQAHLMRDILGDDPEHPVRLYLEEHIDDKRVCEKCGRRFSNHPYRCTSCNSEFIRKWRVKDECSWLTPTVKALAQTAYDERHGSKCVRCKQGVNPIYTAGVGKLRWYGGDGTTGVVYCPDCHGTGRIEDGSLDPDRLSVLADCLEDSGCDQQSIIDHLRGEPCQFCESKGFHDTGLVKCDGEGIHDSRERIDCVACQKTGRRPTIHVRGCAVIDWLLNKK